MVVLEIALLGLAWPDRLRARRLPAAAGRCSSRAVRRDPRRRPASAARARAAARHPVIAAYDEEEVIERKVANALALDYPREQLRGGRRLRRLRRPHRRAGPRGGRRPGARPAARRQGRGAERGRARRPTSDLVAFSDANSFWQPGRAAPAGRALRRRAGRLRLRPGPLHAAARAATRRASTGATRWRCARWSPASPASPRATGASTRSAARPTSSSHPSRGQDIGFPFELTKRGWRAVYEPSAIAEERMAPTVEGEFKRKRRMMWGLWDVMLQVGDARPARLQPRLRARDLLAPPAALPDARGCTWSRSRANAALLGEGDRLRASRWRCSSALLLAAALGRFVPLLPFRIAYYYVTVTASIAVGLCDRLRAGRRPDRLGEGRGDAVSEARRPPSPAAACRAPPTSRSPLSAWSLASPLLLIAAIAIKLGSRGPGDLPPDARRAGRRRVRDVEAAHDAPGLRPGRGRHGGRRRRPARHRRRQVPAPLRARRAAEPGQRAPRRDGDRRARARRCRRRSSSTRRASAAGSS